MKPPPPPGASATDVDWSVDFETLRREELFRKPPRDRTAFPRLAALVAPHLHSFNSIVDDRGLLFHALKDIGTKVFLDRAADDGAGDGGKLSVRIKEVFLDKSVLPPSNKFTARDRLVLPAECRERQASYRGRLRARLETCVGAAPAWVETVVDLGLVPIMVRSSRCHLQHASPAELVQAREESDEFGGYYIVNGFEKMIRQLIVQKRNYPVALSRPKFADRGPTFSAFALSLRSVRPDETSQTFFLHYLTDGNVIFRFSWRKNEYQVPVMMILKALVQTNDREIFEGIVGPAGSPGLEDKRFVIDRTEALLRTYKAYGLAGMAKSRAYIGSRFRTVTSAPEDMSDERAGAHFLRKIVLPHLGAYDVTPPQDRDKFNMLIFMIRKLYSVADGECSIDNADALQFQELLLSGSVYAALLKERLEEWLLSMRLHIADWSRLNKGLPFTAAKFASDFSAKIVRKTSDTIARGMEYFLSTGNLASPTGLDLQQAAGFVIVAERLNFFRFMGHFRSVHRGAFFAQQKTTTVRKLLPESWGFMCPIHTPDGAPCGLLTHLAHQCKVMTEHLDVSTVPRLVAELGVSAHALASLSDSIVVQLDGRVLGYCSAAKAKVIAASVRYWKVKGENGIPLELEVGHVPTSNGGQYPGIYMFSGRARLFRAVRYLPLDKLDYVGPFEQAHMEIACSEAEVVAGQSSHVEYDANNILSILANMTPFSDFNQSPRNMYQCQMAKQTMGTAGTALAFRSDVKTYQLQCGQTPIVRSPLHHQYGLDNFPNGTNAVVAVISYTGYDMDDAMIINQAAHDRAFGYGTIYKTKKLDLDDGGQGGGGGGGGGSGGGSSSSRQPVRRLWGFAPGSVVRSEWRQQLDVDGLPYVGRLVREGEVLAAWHNVTAEAGSGRFANQDGTTHFKRYSDAEAGLVETVRLLGAESGAGACQAVSVTLRIARPPVIGDKFSSRHGQKGVCSALWPAGDLPFSETGIVPDVIINPHAFPSRMTIGMFVESLAGKAGALHGAAQSGAAFSFSERRDGTAVHYFGQQLRAAGFAAAGAEPMYSGITGAELAVDVFVGLVQYQRLRHMVADKIQVRSTGPVAPLTGQPVKGRARGGGIRVGEMERDALLAHGTAFLLQDRLLNCSDRILAWLCRACRAFLGTTPSVVGGHHSVGGYHSVDRTGGKFTATTTTAPTAPTTTTPTASTRQLRKTTSGPVRCRRCASRALPWAARADTWEDGAGVAYVGGDDVVQLPVPGVLKYLDAELASIGVRMRFDVAP